MHGEGGPDLKTAVKLFPTPCSRDWRSGKRKQSSAAFDQLSDQIGGTLNPVWVEWLMGFPEGFTELEPSAMPSSRKSRNGSASK